MEMEIVAHVARPLVDLARRAAQRHLATMGQIGKGTRLVVRANLAYLHVGDQVVMLQY